MRFIAFSDTHDNLNAVRDLISEISKEKVDFFIHAGDVISPFTMKEFEGIERLYVAFGNNDGERNKLTEIAVSSGWFIGEIVILGNLAVYHGTNPETLRMLERNYEVVVTGHTHKAEIRKSEGSIVINPGEVCGYLTGKRSFAVFEDGDVSIVEF